MDSEQFTDHCQEVLAGYNAFYTSMAKKYPGLRHRIIIEKELFYLDNVENVLNVVNQIKTQVLDSSSIDDCLALLTEQEKRLKSVMAGNHEDIAQLAHQAAPYLVKAYNSANLKVKEPAPEEEIAYEEAWEDERRAVCSKRA